MVNVISMQNQSIFQWLFTRNWQTDSKICLKNTKCLSTHLILGRDWVSSSALVHSPDACIDPGWQELNHYHLPWPELAGAGRKSWNQKLNPAILTRSITVKHNSAYLLRQVPPPHTCKSKVENIITWCKD